MARFVLRRIIAMAFVLFAVSVLTFLIFNVIPNGDPAARMAGKNSTPAQIAAIRRDWGFDDPLPMQYVGTMKKVFTGKLISYSTRDNVFDRIKDGAPRTFALAIGAGVLWFVLGVALGLFSATRSGGVTDRLLTILALTGISMPVFWLGALANYYLGFKLGIFPNGGYVTIADGGILTWLDHLILPWLVLSALYIGIYSRVLRASILDTVNDDYVRTARAKGVSERRVLLRHVLRNSMIPIITLWGLDLGATIGGGAILTETVFNLQGVGQYYAESIGRLDVPPVLEGTLFGAFFIVLLNGIVDIVYAALDPRIRLS